MKKILSKVCLINVVCLIIFQIIHVVFEFLKENISRNVELTQSQIMNQMHYSTLQAHLSYAMVFCLFLIAIILCLSIKYNVFKEISQINLVGISIILVLSMLSVWLFNLNIGNVFENIMGLPIVLAIIFIAYTVKYLCKKN